MDFYFISLRLMSIGLVIDSLHSILYYKRYYSNSGIFNLDIMIGKDRKKTSLSKILAFFYPLISEKNFLYFLLFRLLLSILLVLFPDNFFYLTFLVFFLQLLFNIRNTLALSGADQMRTILLFGLSLISLGGNAVYIGYTFIIAQIYISYFFTGFNKIKSQVWRNGYAMIWVLNSELFGSKNAQKFLLKGGKLTNVLLCWAIILFQLTFPLLASIPPTSIYILLIGVLFHLILAIISNLNDFFWTYISAYPIIYYFTNYVIYS